MHYEKINLIMVCYNSSSFTQSPTLIKTFLFDQMELQMRLVETTYCSYSFWCAAFQQSGDMEKKGTSLALQRGLLWFYI